MIVKASEVELGRRVVTWLEAASWDVYQEVATRGGARADIVAVRAGLVAVIELKRGPSLDLVAQLSGWRGKAHYVAAATWRTRSDGFEWICRASGFGWLAVPEYADSRLAWRVEPGFGRVHARSLISKQLRPGHKTCGEAGSANGGGWAPWRDTVQEIVRVATEKPGVTLADAMREAKHHYGSDSAGRRGAEFLLKRGLVPGFRLDKLDGRLVVARAE